MEFVMEQERKSILELVHKLKEYYECEKELEQLPQIKESVYLVLAYQILREQKTFLLSYKEQLYNLEKTDHRFSQEIHNKIQKQLNHLLKEMSHIMKQYSLETSDFIQKTVSEQSMRYCETISFLHDSYIKLDKERNNISNFKETYFTLLNTISSKIQELQQKKEFQIYLKRYYDTKRMRQLTNEIQEIEKDSSLPNIWTPEKRIISNKKVSYLVLCAVHNTEKIVSGENDFENLFTKKNEYTLSKEQKRIELLEEVCSGKLKKFTYMKKED